MQIDKKFNKYKIFKNHTKIGLRNISLSQLEAEVEKVPNSKKTNKHLVIYNKNKPYVIEKITSLKNLQTELKKHPNLIGSDIYLIANYDEKDLYELKTVIKKDFNKSLQKQAYQIEPFVNFMQNNYAWITTITILITLILSTYIKKNWVTLGLPLSALPQGGFFETYMGILFLLFTEAIKKISIAMFIITLIFASAMTLFAPSLGKYSIKEIFFL